MERDRLAAFNERVKLIAAFLNAIGIGLIAVGALRPLAEGVGVTPASIAIWIAVGLAFHGGALYILGQMRKGVTV